MTLALYGKSKRRQGGLVLAGILAVVVAIGAATLLAGTPAKAVTAGPNLPTVANSNVSGFSNWSNPTSAFTDNGQHASHDAEGDGSNGLVLSGFGFAIPANATVDGISVVVQADTDGFDDFGGGGNVCTARVALSWNTQTTYTAAKDELVSESFANISYGSATDTWGRTWAPSDFSNSNFRVRVSAVDQGSDCNAFQDVRVDVVSVAVSYTLPPDTDGDGVADTADLCPGTLPGAPGVDSNGCDFAQQLATSVGTNPAPPTTCDVAFSIVIDRSASFTNAERALTLSQTQAFIQSVFAIPGNSPTFRIVGFADNAIVPLGAQPYTTETDAVTALNSIGVGTYTNWAAGMTAGDGAEVQWMIVITDGNPNRPGAGTDVSLGALQAAVNAANTVKGGGAHITVIGVDTTGNEPNGFGPISQSYAELVGNGDVRTGGLANLATVLGTLTQDCTPPGPDIEKKFAGLNAAGTEASWTVEVKNNSQTTESFNLVEEVTATLYDTLNCNNALSLPSTTNPPAEPGWLCEVDSGVTATYYLTTPVTFNLCTGGNAVNDYYVRYTGTGSPFDPDPLVVPVPANPQACDREIIVDKNFVGLGGYVPTLADVPDLSLPAGVTIKSEGFLDADTYRWVLNAPIDASGEITETNIPAFWMQVDNEECFIESASQEESNLLVQDQLTEVPVADCVFENQPYGTLIINKVDGTSDGSVLWDFTVQNLPANGVNGSGLDSTPQASENQSSTQTYVPLGTGALFVTEDDFRSETACATANTYFTSVIAPNPNQTLDFPGDTVVWNFSNQPCGVLGSGGILIEKWEDVNRNGVIDAGDQRLPGWTFTTTGGGIPPANQVRVTNASGQVLEYVSGFDAGTVLTTSETLQAGWVFVGTDVDGGPMTNDASPDVVIVGGETIVVRFLNQRALVNIVATKTIFNNANPAGANGGAGWTFTLTGCGQPASQKTTDASGSVSWNNLPAAVNCTYTVTETAKAGWIADQISKTAAPVNAGQTVTLSFINRQLEGCTNINDCPPSTPTTATPTNTPVTPTNTPETGETPTEEPTEVPTTPATAIEGERTPGPGDQATPIAPDTGSSFGSTAAGWNALLIIAGLAAISGGLSMIALGRRSIRNG